MSILSRFNETLEEKFTDLAGFPQATFIFGYSQIDLYHLKAIAKKENGVISVRFLRSAKDFAPLSDLSIPNVAVLRSLRWEVQHIYQSEEIPTTPDYCWCGFHNTQHSNFDNCNQLTTEERDIFICKLKKAEICLHRVGLCSNPSNCDCSQPNILNL